MLQASLDLDQIACAKFCGEENIIVGCGRLAAYCVSTKAAAWGPEKDDYENAKYQAEGR